MRKLFLSSFFIMAILLMFSCLGCAGLFAGRYGTIAPDTNAAKAFESFQISANLNYYISGSDEYPNALMGLNKKYTLDSAFWKKIDPSPLRFRDVKNPEVLLNIFNFYVRLDPMAGRVIYDIYKKNVSDFYKLKPEHLRAMDFAIRQKEH